MACNRRRSASTSNAAGGHPWSQAAARDNSATQQSAPASGDDSRRTSSATPTPSRIDAVSGATYTSNSYKTALQAALDKTSLASGTSSAA
jgi:major membrane immunogen (membrane-anchored lipoprotein)